MDASCLEYCFGSGRLSHYFGCLCYFTLYTTVTFVFALVQRSERASAAVAITKPRMERLGLCEKRRARVESTFGQEHAWAEYEGM